MVFMLLKPSIFNSRTLPGLHHIGKRFVSACCEEDGILSGPSVKTEVPGPNSKRELKELSHFQDTAHLMFVIDYENSKGNYVKDIDGNVYLDVNQQSALLPLGYNHTAVLKAVQSKEHLTHLMNTPPLTSVLSGYQGKKLTELLLKIAPSGLNAVHASECGACSLQNATKAALLSFLAYWKEDFRSDLIGLIRHECSGKQNGGEKKCFEILTKEHPDIYFMSFAHPEYQNQVELDRELLVPFPNCRHTESESISHNMTEEGRCLEKVFQLFKGYLSKGRHIGSVRVEPVQNKGSRYASPEFYHSLQAIAREFKSIFIVDEQFTGLGPTGSFWAHEEWDLPMVPDMVILPRKMHLGGFYFNSEVMPNSLGEVMKAYLGDSSKLVILRAVLKEMDDKNLLARTEASGKAVMDGLVKLKETFPEVIKDVHGKGTFCSVELDKSYAGSDLGNHLRKLGLHHVMDENFLCLRPPLIFTPDHAKIACSLLETALTQRCGR